MGTLVIEPPTILLVDDAPANLSLLNSLLKDSYTIKVANSGSKALELAMTAPPDLVLLDIMMPEMDGYEVCRRLKASNITRHVPVIFLTAKFEIEDEELGFSLGAVDFIHKPISPPILTARIKTHLEIKSWNDLLQDQNVWMQKQVEKRLAELKHLRIPDESMSLATQVTATSLGKLPDCLPQLLELIAAGNSKASALWEKHQYEFACVVSPKIMLRITNALQNFEHEVAHTLLVKLSAISNI